MAEDLLSEQWIAKTDFPIGVNLDDEPPEMRYQLLQGRVYTLQVMYDDTRLRGEVQISELPFSVAQGEGWYDGDGNFLGDDPKLPDWVD
jgi:hypothetical protein